jgi:hypothetical protein
MVVVAVVLLWVLVEAVERKVDEEVELVEVELEPISCRGIQLALSM